MPFVNIKIVKEVISDDPAKKKAAITKGVTSAISQSTGIPEDGIWVVFEEVSKTDWFVGQTRVKEMREKS